MGQDQPKKIPRVTKPQIDIACLKARIHLELFRDRKNQEIIKGEKQLVGKIKSKSRNKVEEILIGERVVSALKYAQACQLLISYAGNLRLQAHFIAENMNNPQKMQAFLEMIYGLIFAADHMGLSSLQEFKSLMRALNDPVALQKYVHKDIVNALSPSPAPAELNMYMVEMAERNNIPLEEVNVIGHKFTKDQILPPGSKPPGSSGFSQLQKIIAEDLNNKFKNQGGNGGPVGPGGPGIGGNGGNPPFGGNGGYGGNGGNQYVGGPTGPNQFGGPSVHPGGNTPANLGPNFIVPADIPSKHKDGNVKQSITSINDIDYYPQMQANPALFPKNDFKDPDFDQICDRLRKGL